MANYRQGVGSMDLDEAAEEALKGSGIADLARRSKKYDIPVSGEEGKTASGLPREARGMKSNRIANLPSDDASESNKERQNKKAMEAARLMGMIAGGPTGSIAEAAARKATGYAKGGKVGSASKRADGCAIKGKTRGRIV